MSPRVGCGKIGTCGRSDAGRQLLLPVFSDRHDAESGVDVVFEQHGARKTDFRRGQSIGARDHWMTRFKPSRPVWMSPEAYEAFPDCLEVREMRVRGKILVTTLTPQEASKNELGRLFADRWPVEVDLRHLKTTLGMEALKYKTAEMCEKAL